MMILNAPLEIRDSMILNTKEFKKVCNIILLATDSDTELLELKKIDDLLYLSVTDKEYFISAKFNLDPNREEFHATIKASNFLKLITQITSETIELSTNNLNLLIKANGNYRIPLIYEGTSLLELPVININNVTVNFKIDGNQLYSISTYNSRELLKVSPRANPAQNLYYLDENGCITFTTYSACVNTFQLANPVKVLFNNKLVKLFKLFKDEEVDFKLGYDLIAQSSLIQTKVCFETNAIKLYSITPTSDSLLSKIPVKATRELAEKLFENNVVFSVKSMLDSLNRLLALAIFDKDNATCTISINQTNIKLFDSSENEEVIQIEKGSFTNEEMLYTFKLKIMDFKNILEVCNEQFITLSFGNHRAVVLTRQNISNVLSEVE